MGTNYYLRESAHVHGTGPCELMNSNDPSEGHEENGVYMFTHLGKASGGWVFSMHYYDSLGTMDPCMYLARMEELIARKISMSAIIVDEYGNHHSLEGFMSIVRRDGYAKESLWRSRVDHWHCVASGDISLITGEFC